MDNRTKLQNICKAIMELEDYDSVLILTTKNDKINSTTSVTAMSEGNIYANIGVFTTWLERQKKIDVPQEYNQN